MKKIKLLIGGALVITGLCLFSQVYAARLSISPLTFELTANPGDTLANKLRVYNLSASTIAVKMEKEDFTAVGETGEVRVSPAESDTYSLARWVTISPETFTLEPDEQRFVDFTISIPINAEPGGKYGSVLVSTAGIVGPDQEISGAFVTQKLGALVLLTVSGEVEEELNISDFSVPSFNEYGPVPFTIRFENKGTVHLRPRGFITIVDWRGNKVADVEFPQQNVLPGAVRRIDVSWNQKWLFGRYTATLVGMYGASNDPFNPSVITFWGFPWRIILGGLILLFLLITYFVKTKRRWRMALRILIKGR